MELFECTGLRARLSPAQCRANRTRPVSSSLANLPTRPPACRSCVQWKEIDPPPPEVEDPAEQALAETLATLWSDIDEGRLGVKYILTAYNRRVFPELQKRRSVIMADWLQTLGFRVLDGETFREVRGRRCLLVDAAVEAFVKGRGFPLLQDPGEVAAVDQLLGVVGLKQELPDPGEDCRVSEDPEEGEPVARTLQEASMPAPDLVRPSPDAAPCPQCRYFQPLPTFHGGVEGMRLCWSDTPHWDFACYRPRQERLMASMTEGERV
uniref:Uncharacterized protein n=1 Tax=Desulfovibrio sp. U5L TaxID=596152 RepID=I2Q1C7_9BACT